MKYVITILSILLLLAGSSSAGEFYVGHTFHGASLDPDQAAVGVLVGHSFKLGVELLGDTRIVHGIYETPNRYFVGLGGGYATGHKHFDGNWQFTVTAGIRLKPFTLRWIHHSNGSDFLHSGDKEAHERNMGVDIFTLSLPF